MAQNRSKVPLVAGVLGVVLLIVGVTTYLAGGAGEPGWVAVAENAEEALAASGATVVEAVQWLGILLGVIGGLLISWALGYAIGRRRGTHTTSPGSGPTTGPATGRGPGRTR